VARNEELAEILVRDVAREQKDVDLWTQRCPGADQALVLAGFVDQFMKTDVQMRCFLGCNTTLHAGLHLIDDALHLIEIRWSRVLDGSFDCKLFKHSPQAENFVQVLDGEPCNGNAPVGMADDQHLAFELSTRLRPRNEARISSRKRSLGASGPL